CRCLRVVLPPTSLSVAIGQSGSGGCCARPSRQGAGWSCPRAKVPAGWWYSRSWRRLAVPRQVVFGSLVGPITGQPVDGFPKNFMVRVLVQSFFPDDACLFFI